MLIYTSEGFRPFYAPVTPPAPPALIALHREWIAARNKSIAEYNELREFSLSRTKFYLNGGRSAFADLPALDPIELPAWCARS